MFCNMIDCKIPLRNKNKEIIDYAIIDQDDFENVDKYTWYRACPSKRAKTKKYYARSVIANKHISLHHFLLGKPEKSKVVDHIDGNGLNNKKDNLRFVTKKQNGQNRILDNAETKTSKYIGVCLTASKTWATFCSSKNLGTFKDEIDAAKRYDSYVLKVYGPNALCNNLIKYEDIVNIDIIEFLPKVIKRDLPDNITLYKPLNKYIARIIYKGREYKSNYFENIEDAKLALEDFKERIAKIKEQEKIQYNLQEIERNSDGIAIINAFNKDKVIVKQILIDDDLWYELNQFKCCFAGNYAIITIKNKPIPMHIYIHGRSEDDNLIIDHINQNKCDNRRQNLRFNTATGNNHNQPKKDDATSIYKGVHLSKGKWSSNIRKNNKYYNLGIYDSELLAAIAYNVKAKELYGEFANLNDISEINYEKNYDDVVKIMNNIEKRDNKSISSSKFRGVNKTKYNSFNANIIKNKENFYLGNYKLELQAAIAYNIKSKKLNGKKAKLNEILEEDNEKYYDEVFKNMQRLKII